MNCEHDPGPFAQSRSIVLKPGFVGSAHFDHSRAALGDDVGHAKRPADLHQFAPGNDDIAIRRETLQRQHDCGSAIIDRQRGFGAGNAAKQGLHVVLAGPALAGPEVELQVRIARGSRLYGPDCLGRERRPPQVGVQNDAGGVDRAAQARQPPFQQFSTHQGRVLRTLKVGQLRQPVTQAAPHPRQVFAHDFRHFADRELGAQRRPILRGQPLVDGW